MPFSFTFSLSVPGLNNPFLAATSQSESGSHQRPVDNDRQLGHTASSSSSALIPARRIPIPPHRHRTLAATHLQSLSPPVPLARKRGWAPSSPEPSQATTNNTSTSGYLDTPAKYRNHMSEREPERETEEMIAGMCVLTSLSYRSSVKDRCTPDPKMMCACAWSACPAHMHVWTRVYVHNDMPSRPFTQHVLARCSPKLSYATFKPNHTFLNDHLFNSLLSPIHTHSFPSSLMHFNILIIINVDLPPAKRRRTLAGSIVSTALSAALIGTAVGLTVYRLWRDRGKDTNRTITDVTDDQPPPPYHPGDWVAAVAPPKQPEITPTPQSKRNAKSRHHVPTSTRRTPVVRQRRARVGVRAAGTPPPAHGASPHLTTFSSTSHPHPGFDIAPSQQTDGAKAESDTEFDEMDWIGGRLSQLIEEGQKALNREIVVMSDAKEDEVDDGEGDWEEEPEPSKPVISRRGSMRSLRSAVSPKKRRFDANEAYLPLPSSSRPSSSWQPTTPTSPRHAHTRGLSAEAERGSNHTPIIASFREDESSWGSAELRESMARARAQYMQNCREA